MDVSVEIILGRVRVTYIMNRNTPGGTVRMSMAEVSLKLTHKTVVCTPYEQRDESAPDN